MSVNIRALPSRRALSFAEGLGRVKFIDEATIDIAPARWGWLRVVPAEKFIPKGPDGGDGARGACG